MASGIEHEILQLALDVAAAANLTPKSRGTSIKPTVDKLTSLAYEHGLPSDALRELLTVLCTENHLDQASLNAITRTLYPVTKVPRADVLLVMSALGNGKAKPSLSVQAGLLRWLVMVYHVLETPALLGQAYAVLFNLLDTGAFRPQLTHVLALITRRKHVRPFRIQYLLHLSRQTGNDPCLVGLLRVYKDYYPEIIVGEAVRGKASAFKHPDPQWREHLDHLQETHVQLTQENAAGPRDGFRVNKPLGRAKRSKAIPTVHTTHANEDSVTLEEVENVTSFVAKIDKLELPNQLVAVLADPLLQKLLILRPSAESNQRIANWLSSVLQDIADGDADYATLWEVMDVVRDFVTSTKTLPVLILNFFARFLQLWDGTGNRECVLEILSFCPFVEFDDVYKTVFQPLEVTLVADGQLESQLSLLTLYTNILHHWASVLRAANPFPRNATRSVTALIQHAHSLCLTLFQNSATIETEAAVLSLYEQMLDLVQDPKLGQFVRVELPPAELVCTMLLSSSLATVSRTCYILVCFRNEIGKVVKGSAGPGTDGKLTFRSYSKGDVNRINAHVADVCNSLWLWKAFDDKKGTGLQVPRPTVDALARFVTSVDRKFSLAAMMSFSYSPVFCRLSINRMRDIEDERAAADDTIETRHPGPVSPQSLIRLASSGGIKMEWQEYQVQVIETLDKQGFEGIGTLLRTAITSLKTQSPAKAIT